MISLELSDMAVSSVCLFKHRTLLSGFLQAARERLVTANHYRARVDTVESVWSGPASCVVYWRSYRYELF
jgi:hypothetical protein